MSAPTVFSRSIFRHVLEVLERTGGAEARKVLELGLDDYRYLSGPSRSRDARSAACAAGSSGSDCTQSAARALAAGASSESSAYGAASSSAVGRHGCAPFGLLHRLSHG